MTFHQIVQWKQIGIMEWGNIGIVKIGGTRVRSNLECGDKSGTPDAAPLSGPCNPKAVSRGIPLATALQKWQVYLSTNLSLSINKKSIALFAPRGFRS